MPTDYLEDENGDLAFGPNGDFVVGESTKKHKKDLLLAQKGEFRQWPEIGVGIADFLQDDRLAELGAVIKREFENDGIRVKKIDVFTNGKISEQGSYDQ